MSNLKALKARIKSVKSTQKMTKAMKMVAASKLRKAKRNVELSRPYAEKIDELISDLAANINFRDHHENFELLAGRKEEKNYLLVVLSSDRGLCGGLNSSAVKFAKRQIINLEAKGKNVKILCIGKKAYDQLKPIYGNKIIDLVGGIFKKDITTDVAKKVVDKILTLFAAKEFDVCQVIYSKFKSAIAQEAKIKQIIPIAIEQEELDDDLPKFNSPFVFEPDQEEILANLLPQNLTMQIYNELLENSASEQGARMAAMEAATNNAGKMIKNLTLIYNRTRQANITKELIDIVSGANSV